MRNLVIILLMLIYGTGIAQEAAIIGEWRLTTLRKGNEEKRVNSGLVFEENGVLKLGLFNMEEIIEAGKWRYNSNENTIEMSSSIDSNCNGIAKIILISDSLLVYNKAGIEYYLERMNKDSKELTPFEFNESDFFTEDGLYKYNDEEKKLPWQDISYMVKSLENVDKLIYEYSRWDEASKSYDIKTLTANVNANLDEMKLQIDYVFYGYDRYNLPKDTEFPSNVYYSSILYPEQDINFRVIGTEELNTSVGVYNCTVIEAAEAETKKKLWMINDMPGIYAKIIVEKMGFGMYYHGIFKIKEIL